MTSRKPRRVPSYRLHKHSGKAVVTLNGRDHYLGQFGTDESRAEYEREWLIRGRQLPQESTGSKGPTINELILAYWVEAERYYQRDGEPTTELESMRLALRYVRRTYGRTLAKDFGPMALKACRETMIAKDLSRGVCNGYTKRIKRLFRWGVENEMVPPSVFHALQAVRGLRKGRSPAREPERVRPVPEKHVEAVMAVSSAPVQAMIRLQLLTGMRPGEVVQMRGAEIDRSGEVWIYRPRRHKTEHHGYERMVPLGPRAQQMLEAFLSLDPCKALFSPRDAERARSARRRQARKTPMTPSQARRRRRKRKREPGDQYTTASYRRAVARGCKAAKVPSWHPHQLRHNAATRLRAEFGVEATSMLLGHRSVAVTEIYAEQNRGRAVEIMARVG